MSNNFVLASFFGVCVCVLLVARHTDSKYKITAIAGVLVHNRLKQAFSHFIRLSRFSLFVVVSVRIFYVYRQFCVLYRAIEFLADCIYLFFGCISCSVCSKQITTSSKDISSRSLSLFLYGNFFLDTLSLFPLLSHRFFSLSFFIYRL